MKTKCLEIVIILFPIKGTRRRLKFLKPTWENILASSYKKHVCIRLCNIFPYDQLTHMIATYCRMSYVMNFVYMTCNTGEVTRPFSYISRGVIWVNYFLHFLVWFLLWVLFESAGGNEVILVWRVTLFWTIWHHTFNSKRLYAYILEFVWKTLAWLYHLTMRGP